MVRRADVPAKSVIVLLLNSAPADSNNGGFGKDRANHFVKFRNFDEIGGRSAQGLSFQRGSQPVGQSLDRNRYARLPGMCFRPVHAGRRAGDARVA